MNIVRGAASQNRHPARTQDEAPLGCGVRTRTQSGGDSGRRNPADVCGQGTSDGTVTISCTIANTGDRPGDEVVQLYLRDDHASVTRPVQELKGFVRLPLEAGESWRVIFVVPIDMLSFVGIDLRRIVEPGTTAVMVGASSADIRLKGQFTVTGEVRSVGEDRRLTSTVEITDP